MKPMMPLTEGEKERNIDRARERGRKRGRAREREREIACYLKINSMHFFFELAYRLTRW